MGLSLGASAYVILAPCFIQGIRGSSTLEYGAPSVTTTETYCRSYGEGRGPGVFILLAFPVVLALVGLLAARWNLKMIVGLCAVFLHLFWLVTGFSIGMFYIPAAIAMMVAAVLAFVIPSHKPPDVTHPPEEGSEDFDSFGPDRPEAESADA